MIPDNIINHITNHTINHFITKWVEFRFKGQEFVFALSQSLFSSFEIDTGSKLLLKTIGDWIDANPSIHRNIKHILDLGCGVGVLGISLAKIFPESMVEFQDRDALAVAFTQWNAIKNGLTNFKTRCGLAYEGIRNELFDIIISNLPAKAGYAALKYMIDNSLMHLSDNGILALVIVNSLPDLHALIENHVKEKLFSLLSFEEGKRHRAYILRKERQIKSGNVSLLLPYFRKSVTLADIQTESSFLFQLRTVYGLKNFDSMDYQTYLTIKLLNKAKSAGKSLAGNLLIWNPGQGHVPVYTIRTYTQSIKSIILASRDKLSILISKYNIESVTNYSERQISIFHIPCLGEVKDCSPNGNNKSFGGSSFDTAILLLNNEPYYYSDSFIGYLRNALRNKYFLISGQSTLISRILKNKANMKKIKIIFFLKNKGYRGIFGWFSH